MFLTSANIERAFSLSSLNVLRSVDSFPHAWIVHSSYYLQPYINRCKHEDFLVGTKPPKPTAAGWLHCLMYFPSSRRIGSGSSPFWVGGWGITMATFKCPFCNHRRLLWRLSASPSSLHSQYHIVNCARLHVASVNGLEKIEWPRDGLHLMPKCVNIMLQWWVGFGPMTCWFVNLCVTSCLVFRCWPKTMRGVLWMWCVLGKLINWRWIMKVWPENGKNSVLVAGLYRWRWCLWMQ